MTLLTALILLITSLTGIPSVHDGDTLTIGKTRIRILGIDAPELDQLCGYPVSWPCGVASKQALEAKVHNHPVECSGATRDRGMEPQPTGRDHQEAVEDDRHEGGEIHGPKAMWLAAGAFAFGLGLGGILWLVIRHEEKQAFRAEQHAADENAGSVKGDSAPPDFGELHPTPSRRPGGQGSSLSSRMHR